MPEGLSISQIHSLWLQAKAAFQELRTTLQTNGGQFVLGKLTFADLAMAVATSTIEPFGPRYGKP